MNFKDFESKKIYLSPLNDQTKEFYLFLKEKIDFNFLGYIDNYKKDINTYSIEELNKEYDFILLLSPQYSKEIAQHFKLNNFNKLLYAMRNDILENKYFIFKNFHIYNALRKLNLDYKRINKFLHINHLSIYRYKNKYKNQKKRAFILGNGPSLNIQDLSSLENEITFAANKIYLSFEQTKWRPSYYFVIDKLVYEQNYETIKNLKLKKFFTIDMLEKLKKLKNSTYFNIDNTYDDQKMPIFSIDPINGLHKGNTVVYSMMQFAVYMGIKEIYFIGMDFNFIVPKSENSSDKFVKSEGEVNHFHKDYRKVGEKWNKPNLPAIENAFIRLREYCYENDIKVYNATRGGKLEILKRIDFDSLF